MDNPTNSPANPTTGVPRPRQCPHPLGGAKVHTVAELFKALKEYDDWLCISIHQYGGDPPILSITGQDGDEKGWIEIG